MFCMAIDSYSRKERIVTRKKHILSMIFNSASFNLLASNIVITYLLRFGAKEDVGGLIAGFSFISVIFVIFGKFSIGRIGLVKTYGIFWSLRYLAVLPMAFSPFLYSQGYIGKNSVILLCLISLFAFHVFRGVALSTQSPLLNEASEGPDKGSFLSSVQIAVQMSILITVLAAAFTLRFYSSLNTYFLLYLLGLFFGFIACFIILSIKEPETNSNNLKVTFKETFLRIFKNKNIKNYFVFLGIIVFMLNFIKPYLLFYTKRIYNIEDGTLLFLAIITNLGAVSMGMLVKLFIDKIGEKPTIMIGYLFFFVSTTIIALLNKMENPFLYLGVIGVLFFFQGCSDFAINVGLQKYLYFIMDPKDNVNMFVFSNVLKGILGGLSSILGGFFILFIHNNLFPQNSDLANYKFFYSLSLFLFAIPFFFLIRLKRLNAMRSSDAIMILANPINIFTMKVLKKLEYGDSLDKEINMLTKLSNANVVLTKEEITKRIKSPFIEIKYKALKTLQNIKINYKKEKELKKVLEEELEKDNEVISIIILKIIEKNKLKEFSNLILSMLEKEEKKNVKARMIRTLNILTEGSELKTIKNCQINEDNEGVLFSIINSISIFGDKRDLPFLLLLFKKENLRESIRNELVLIMAKLNGFEKDFYTYYTLFRRKEAQLKEHFEEFFEGSKYNSLLKKLYHSFEQDDKNSFVETLFSLEKDMQEHKIYFEDKGIYEYSIMRFFIMFYINKFSKNN